MTARPIKANADSSTQTDDLMENEGGRPTVTRTQGARIHISGMVQGVGFRPFVYGLATALHLTGWVRNTSAGVDIEVDGRPEPLAAFIEALARDAPPLARIDHVEVEARPAAGFATFEIVPSTPLPDAFQPISPDVSICPDCLRELFDPADRRYRYPFINCTNCGPRFTIVKNIPYDRPLTTMAPFPLCPACAAEYHDPLDRRFHAQPVACPDCGPHIWLESDSRHDEPLGEAAIGAARRLLAEGAILAVKGLGGFHLACDATNPATVAALRQRKLRVDKPFAVMMPDLAAVERHCWLTPAERALLTSRERPIVVVERREESLIVAGVAPNQKTVGVMLPYTPLHILLLEPAPDVPEALVMTSGNLSEEPIAYANEDARVRLAPLADAFLLHNRAIHIRCDDSVVRAVKPTAPAAGADRAPQRAIYPLRRARGYAPAPLLLPWSAAPLLATGAELKNTFCLTRERYAFLSHHIGDLKNYETLGAFEAAIDHYERLFRVRPEAVAHDLHPDYLATRYAVARAEREGLPAVAVQHHHAHIAACMAEHGLPGEGTPSSEGASSSEGRRVIGLSFDGTGYGDDGAVWGGEVLLADYTAYERAAHLAYVPLPGGDQAVREPWRMALAWLHHAGIDWDGDLPPVRHAQEAAPSFALPALARQLQTGLNAPPTSSVGRLFDAVAALIGVAQVVGYEAQAAIELEALADPSEEGAYRFARSGKTFDAAPVIAAAVEDLRAGVAPATISARFHNGLAALVTDLCLGLRAERGLSRVVLSGGVWQNTTLLTTTLAHLEAADFTLFVHRDVPANDGGLALGQAAVAAWKLR